MTNDLEVFCPECGKLFNSEAEMLKHLEKHHNEEAMGPLRFDTGKDATKAEPYSSRPKLEISNQTKIAVGIVAVIIIFSIIAGAYWLSNTQSTQTSPREFKFDINGEITRYRAILYIHNINDFDVHNVDVELLDFGQNIGDLERGETATVVFNAVYNEQFGWWSFEPYDEFEVRLSFSEGTFRTVLS